MMCDVHLISTPHSFYDPTQKATLDKILISIEILGYETKF